MNHQPLVNFRSVATAENFRVTKSASRIVHPMREAFAVSDALGRGLP